MKNETDYEDEGKHNEKYEENSDLEYNEDIYM